MMTLKATGLSGQVGASAPIALQLPQRDFHNPLARALVEQRRDLILDPDHDRPRLAKAIAALLIAPEVFQHAGRRLPRAARRAIAPRGGARRRRSHRGRRSAVGDGGADRRRRRLAGAARSARRRTEAARGASARRQRRRDSRADQGIARSRRALHARPRAAKIAGANEDDRPMAEKDLESMLDRFEDTARNGARRGRRGDARPVAEHVREHAKRARRRGGPGDARDAQTD